MGTGYHYFNHDADIGIEAEGPTLESAFEHAACAMFAIMCPPAMVLSDREVRVEFDEPDQELALAEWLNKLLAQARLEGLMLAGFELQRDGDHYSGKGWGIPWKPGADRGPEVKGATLTQLKVAQEGKRWRVRCVVDV